jgi:hypothetical protein
METTVTLVYSVHKRKRMNTLEIYYIHYVQQYNTIIKEQNQKQKMKLIRTNSRHTVPPSKRIMKPP